MVGGAGPHVCWTWALQLFAPFAAARAFAFLQLRIQPALHVAAVAAVARAAARSNSICSGIPFRIASTAMAKRQQAAL